MSTRRSSSGSSSSSIVNGSSRNMGISDIPKSGRELAIEALIDLDDRGPSFRIGQVLNDAPSALADARPNKITKAALFDAAQSLSNYQYPTGGYLRHAQNHTQIDVDVDKDVDKDAKAAKSKKDQKVNVHIEDSNSSSSSSSVDGKILFKDANTTSTSTTPTREPPNEKEKERVMKHFARIVMAKYSSNSSTTSSIDDNVDKMAMDIDDDNEDVDMNMAENSEEDAVMEDATGTGINTSASSTDKGEEKEKVEEEVTADKDSVSLPTAYPPPQVIAALRRIYGSHSSDRLQEFEDGTSTSTSPTISSDFLPGLIQSIKDHPIFSTTKKNDNQEEEKENSEIDDNSTSNDKKNDDTSDTKKESTDEKESEHDEKKAQVLAQTQVPEQPTNSPVANLEAIIGKACNTTIRDENDQNGDFLLGICIAAFSVLTTCITEPSTTSTTTTSPFLEEENGLLKDAKIKLPLTSSSLSPLFHQNIASLQVAGPLSLLSNTSSENKDDLLLQPFSNLLLNPLLMNYFMQAASICEERDEIQKVIESTSSKVDGEKMDDDKGIEPKDSTTDDNNDNHKNSNDNDGSDDKKEGDDATADEKDELAVNDRDVSDMDVERPNEHVEPEENERLFPEPAGHSFEVDEDDDDGSSSHDDDSSSSSSSDEEEIDQEEVEEQEEAQHDSDEQEYVKVDEEHKEEEEHKEVIDSSSQDVKMEETETDSNLLQEAIALSLSENVKTLPPLPTHPEKEYLPKDVTSLNPTSLETFGKLSTSSVLVSLLNISLANVKHRKIDSRNYSATIHIMIAMLNTLSCARVESINGLFDLYQALKEYGKQYNDTENIVEDDDPAFATSQHVASAYSSSESLEEKGLMRKAAAAAQSASLQRAKIQQNIDELREHLKLYSLCSFLLMKSLRFFIQNSSIVSIERQSNDLLPFSISTITRVRLIASLTNFMSTNISTQYHSMCKKSNQCNLDEISLLPRLLLEATSLWGESTPLTYPSSLDLENQLKHLLMLCFPSTFSTKGKDSVTISFHGIKSPWSELDANLLKLDSMCRRMRSKDVINHFVSSPKTYNDTFTAPERQNKNSSIYPLLSKIYYGVLPSCDQCIVENIKGLFLALHHSLNQHSILWGISDATYLDVPSFNTDTHHSTRHTPDGSDAKVYLTKNYSYAFDSSKCADSIALVSSETGPLSANQRASKVWGTVLSSKAFSPKTGVHRWAVRLDKCERGHVFVGVATSRASKKTYVGGDKYSWGVIGTQALWHERRKIRSDYGDTFRSGSIVVITLDTDAGTLGFGVLHDSETSTSDESPSEPINIISSRSFEGERYAASGFVEDWGIAFEGLPLDAKLYPAVGLYQRDDKISLLSVTRNKKGPGDSLSHNDIVHGSLFYPEKDEQNSSDDIDMSCIQLIRDCNSSVCNDGILFTSCVLNRVNERLESDLFGKSDLYLFRTILPSIASSLSLYPFSIPILSGRFAMTVLPLIRQCIRNIEKKISKLSKRLGPASSIKSGKWTLRAAPCTSSTCAPEEYEEYIVDLEKDEELDSFHGTGIGTNGKSINCKVSIVGACRGTSIQFVEEWRDECDTSPDTPLPTSSCVIDARLNLFGTSFEGVYKNVHYGKCGSITGVLATKKETNEEGDLAQYLILCSSLLGNAASHLSYILSSGAPSIDVAPVIDKEYESTKDRLDEIQRLVLSSPILSTGFSSKSQETSDVESCFHSITSQFSTSDTRIKHETSYAFSYWKRKSLSSLIRLCKADEVHLSEVSLGDIHDFDIAFAPQCGGLGSLSILEPSVYRSTREKIIAVLLRHTGLTKLLSSEKLLSIDVKVLWQTALKIIETGVRKTLFTTGESSSRRESCIRYCKHADSISDLLMKVLPQSSPLEDTINYVEEIYLYLSKHDDLTCVVDIMNGESRKYLLQYLGMSTIQDCLNKEVVTPSMIESILSSLHLHFERNRDTGFQISDESFLQTQRRETGIKGHITQIKCDILNHISSYLTKMLNDSKSWKSEAFAVSLQSLAMTVLANIFSLAGRYSYIFQGITCWNFLKSLICACKRDIDRQLRKEEVTEANKSQSKSAKMLLNSMKRYTSSITLNNASSVLHVILFSLHNSEVASQEEITSMSLMPMSILKSEISDTLNRIKEEHIIQNEIDLHEKAARECSSWINCTQEESEVNIQLSEDYSNESNISTGITYIFANGGAFAHSGSHASCKSLDSIILAYNSCERYLNLLLDILSSLVRSKIYPHWIQHDNTWIRNLCDVLIGNVDECSLSLHFRIRILRLLRSMIVKSAPDIQLMTDLLQYVGGIILPPLMSDQNLQLDHPEMECYLEAKEIVSLLRTMCINGTGSFEESSKWLNYMNDALMENSPRDEKVLRGIHAFYGGIPDKLVVGSCVLLRPSVASNLSAASSQTSMKSSTSANRSKSAFSNMAPIAACSGAEGIVAGLCRRDALAGRISDIDIIRGTCEIVLLERFDHMKKSINDESDNSMSVRAIKVPLQDVVAADEVALLIDSEHCPVSHITSSPLSESLEYTTSLLEQINDIESVPEQSQIEIQMEKVFDTILRLRSGTVIFSNNELIQKYLHDEEISKNSKSKLFYHLLNLAALPSVGEDNPYINSACSDSLSSLPEYQARFWFLRGLLSEIIQRKSSIKTVSLEKLCKIHADTGEDEKNVITPTKDNSNESKYITPPAPMRATETVQSDGGGHEISRRQGSGADSTEFHSNSIETVNDEEDENENENENEDEKANENENDEEEEEASSSRLAEEAEAAHLREAAIVQMAELGLPRSWSEYALRRVGGSNGTNIEAAVNFCLERGGDIERLLMEEEERNRRSSTSSSRRRAGSSGTGTSHLLRQLVEMGFPPNWCAEALSSTGHNVDEALTWMIRNGERLSALDEGVDNNEDDENDIEEDDSGSVDDEGGPKSESDPMQTDEKEVKEIIGGWKHDIVCPLRSISGRTNIDHKTLTVKGLPTGGFSSIGMKGIPLETGKWYYEAELLTDGCLQIGWADSSFSGHCQAERGDGCGDGPSSWAFDGWRRYRWHCSATEWGCRWKKGDIVGCLLDMDEKEIRFTLNGRGEEIGMGLAFSGDGFRPCGGVYACVSFNRKEQIRLILGDDAPNSFHFSPPPGYKGVGEAVAKLVKEREELMKIESVIPSGKYQEKTASRQSYLCDFSDGEHGHELFAWQHRYYGADASVHLGGRRNRSKSSNKRKSLGMNSSPSSKNIDDLYQSTIDSRLSKIWENKDTAGKTKSMNLRLIEEEINKGYDTVIQDVMKEIRDNGLAICILYARKFIMHMVITLSSEFDLTLFHQDISVDNDLKVANKLWTVFEKCCSLHAAGWVGEAGAMAVASEALGLSISSHDRTFHSSPFSNILGIGTMKNGQESEDTSHLPTAALSQFLSTVKIANVMDGMLIDPSSSLASCAEAALGGDVGGSAVFIRRSLQNAIINSSSMLQVLLAVIRRSVRILSSVEYGDTSPNVNDSDEDEDDNDDDDDTCSQGNEFKSPWDVEFAPDARLVSFLTGLLLSNEVSSGLESDVNEISSQFVADSLFVTWSIGLLSASAPWRMVCAMTVTSILNLFPGCIKSLPASLPTISNFYSRLYSTVARRLWAERSALPVCSLYAQSFVDLACSVRKAMIFSFPECSLTIKGPSVDAATPIPMVFKENKLTQLTSISDSWEWNEGWTTCDAGWDIWTGAIEYHAIDWMTPSRSAVRGLTDGGEGPPMLCEGCTVMRGLDWDDDGSGTISDNEDGKDLYEKEKEAKDVESKDDAEKTGDEESSPKKKTVLPKLPVGKVIAIEPWKGIPGLARRVKWNLTNEEGLYRYGGDGGRFDIAHVEVNDKSTRVRKRHPLPESQEQCTARYGFGRNRQFSILLRCYKHLDEIVLEDGEKEIRRQGILEMPDFGAGILVDCIFYSDGAVAITEKRLLFGSKDSGWEPRFGQPSYVSGTTIMMSMTNRNKGTDLVEEDSCYVELLGSTSYPVKNLRNRANGEKIRVTSEMRLLRGNVSKSNSSDSPEDLVCSPLPPPICFDKEFHASSMCLSRDRRTVTCTASEGRCTAFGSVGFTKGVHYWEVKIEQADTGSIFIGVAEKPSSDTSTTSAQFGSDSQSRLNRWLGWGFVNFRATYSAGAERVYGAHCHASDTIGVLLDCDAGRLSFFFDGIKYGEHIMNDLGCAYENISPFGFNADGCGSSGAGHGAPNGCAGHGRGGGRYPSNGAIQPKALWPVVGMRHPGDRVTFSAKWMSSKGVDATSVLENALKVDDILSSYENSNCIPSSPKALEVNPLFLKESYQEFERWREGRYLRSTTRASGPQNLSSSGLDIDIDTSPLACAIACASLGLKFTLLPGDHVSLKRSAGRMLELPEEARILGACQGRLWYRITSQKSEGGSLGEGGGRAWFWDESEVVDNSLQVIGKKNMTEGIELPLTDKFKCCASGGIRIIYSEGAVVRSDLEFFHDSKNLGTIPEGTVIPQKDVFERRMNSCGVARLRVRFEAIGEGWISSRIRGGKEEAIVEYVYSADKEQTSEGNPEVMYDATDSGKIWSEEYSKLKIPQKHNQLKDLWSFSDSEEYEKCLSCGLITGLTPLESDSLLSSFISSASDFSPNGDAVEASFELIASALFLSLKNHNLLNKDDLGRKLETEISIKSYQDAASKFSHLSISFPPMKCLLARVAMLRALNRRAMYALPWLLSRPSQESSAILGGLSGLGASIERSGKSKQCELSSMWVQASSSGNRLRSCRSLLFGSVKRKHLQRIIDATMTPTPLSHDEYELPREVRTVRVNRVKARHIMSSTDISAKKKYSVFSQLQNETRGWSGAAFRRGHVAKGHFGQKRAFKVKLVGEGVNDYSGPYREVFTDAMREVTSTEESNTISSLAVLDASPNRAADIGEDRSLFVFSFPSSESSSEVSACEFKISEEEEMIRQHYSSYLIGETEGVKDIEDSISFLGKLSSTAVRHGILVDLPLSLESVWKPLCEEESTPKEALKELDLLSSRYSEDNSLTPLLAQQQRMLNSFAEGISNAMPLEIFSIFSGSELRDFYCGNFDIDVDLLQKIVEYEGYDKNDTIIKHFWEVLREMTSRERTLFLQFVWARSRLPMKESDFEDPFKIQKDMKNSGDKTHIALPSASTCFFSLSLPEYQSKETLKSKLLFAINNVTTMESDYVTNESEVKEGWRGM